MGCPQPVAFSPRSWTLLKSGHENVAYIDDSLLQGDSYEQCMNNIINTMKFFDSLGLTVHPDKIVIVPVY